jgi:hypothetical protein
MPFRQRIQALWRRVAGLWRPHYSRSLSHSPAADGVGSAAVGSRPRPPERAGGEPLIGGAVTVRMWSVGGLLVLATSDAEAERALVGLLGRVGPGETQAARALLDELRSAHASAA